MLSLIADPLYDLTDTAILGHVGTTALGGAALASVILGLGYGVFIFLMFGTTATVARLMGRGEGAEAAHRGVQGLWLGGTVGLVAAAVLWPLGPSLVGLFGGRGAVGAAAVTYFRISLLGFPAFLIVMAGTGYLRGTKDTVTPLVIATSTVALNVAIEVALIYGLGFGVGASALGTVIAKWTGALVFVVLVARSALRHERSLRPDRRALRQLSSAGAPLFVRTVALRLALALGTRVAGAHGAAALAAYAIAFEIWNALAYVADGLEVAGQALVGALLGASDEAGARAVGRHILGWAALIGVVGGLLVGATHQILPHLFTADPTVRSLAALSLWWVAAMQPVNAVTFSLDGILVGADDLRFLALAMMGALVVFAPLAWAAARPGLSLNWLWAALVVFMLARAGALGARFAGDGWVRLGVTARSRPSGSSG